MALPMLVGGSECGPSNPLQGLSKRFDQDRGIQQDHFGAGRAGSSRDGFRTQGTSNGQQDADAARFFGGGQAAHAPQFHGDPLAYDLSSMRAALPLMQNQHQPSAQNPLASWASDFVVQHIPAAGMMASSSSGPQMVSPMEEMQLEHQQGKQMTGINGISSQAPMSWNVNPTYGMNAMHGPGYMPQMVHQLHISQQQPVISKKISWDKAFSAQETQLATPSSQIIEVQNTTLAENETATRSNVNEGDELARTAAMLLENIRFEQNPKFQKSQFMGLMKQLRDGEIIVEGNQMVESNGRTSESVNADVKGKGRALGSSIPIQGSSSGGAIPVTMASSPLHALNQPYREVNQSMSSGVAVEDENDAYFRQENRDFMDYWDKARPAQLAALAAQHTSTETLETLSWDKLQQDWDNFEATTGGIKPITHYQFQHSNPYLLGDSSTSRNHLMHTGARMSVLESVLELEAAVQRNMGDATAWYELGVKQQENEREHKALQALQRAVELEPGHLPSWLALAISYTNDNNRQGAYDSVHEWVGRNAKYTETVHAFRTINPENSTGSLGERYSQLIQCLITMARGDVSGEVDADIQIALAVLLNTNEEYEKAQDCFRTALAVRPDDWLLYNRVGATMANSGRAEEALDYYYRALELNPGYIRARFNLGISCINLRRYEEAAQHILDALMLQENDGVQDHSGSDEKRGVVSTALWDSLKTTCLHMQRADLATLCDLKDLEGFRNRFH